MMTLRTHLTRTTMMRTRMRMAARTPSTTPVTAAVAVLTRRPATIASLVSGGHEEGGGGPSHMPRCWLRFDLLQHL